MEQIIDFVTNVINSENRLHDGDVYDLGGNENYHDYRIEFLRNHGAHYGELLRFVLDRVPKMVILETKPCTLVTTIRVYRG